MHPIKSSKATQDLRARIRNWIPAAWVVLIVLGVLWVIGTRGPEGHAKGLPGPAVNHLSRPATPATIQDLDRAREEFVQSSQRAPSPQTPQAPASPARALLVLALYGWWMYQVAESRGMEGRAPAALLGVILIGVSAVKAVGSFSTLGDLMALSPGELLKQPIAVSGSFLLAVIGGTLGLRALPDLWDGFWEGICRAGRGLAEGMGAMVDCLGDLFEFLNELLACGIAGLIHRG